MTKHLEAAVDVGAPAEEVWAALVDWPTQGSWMMATTVTSIGEGMGATLRAFTGVGRIGFLDEMRITSWDPPRRCDVLHLGRLVRGTGTFLVEPVSPTASRMTWIEDLDLPGGPLGRIAFAVVERGFMGALRHSLRRFASMVESSKSL